MTTLQPLKVGSKGPLVLQWETFLRGLDLLNDREVDSEYTESTLEATRTFQAKFGGGRLTPDGKAGNQTIGFAMSQFGFELIPTDDKYPALPAGFKPLDSVTRATVLGVIQFRPQPTPDNPEGIKVTNNWQAENLGSVVVPQLKGVYGAPASGKIFFHKKAIPQLQAMFAAWEKAGLTKKILSWGGSWNPRFIRGSRSVLSNHAWASAFDINVPWNGLGRRPALVGEMGSVRELVPIAAEHGFYWGGWFGSSGGSSGRLDGMHFELMKLLPM